MLNHQFSIGYSSLEYPQIEKPDEEVIGLPVIKTERDENGRLVQKVVFEVDKKSERLKGLTIHDFSLEDMIDNGLQLQRVDYHGLDFNQIDAASNAVDSLSKFNAELAAAKAREKANENPNVEPLNND